MRSSYTAVLVLALSLSPSVTWAQKAKKSPAPDGTDTVAVLEPGKCLYQQPTLKQCATSHGRGVFEVQTNVTGATYIEFPDGVKQVTKPAADLYSVQFIAGERAVYVKAKPGAPDNVPVVVVTESLTVTLTLRNPTTKGGDSQVEIKDPDAADRLQDREATLAERERAIAEHEAKLEARAAARADTQLLEDVAATGVALGSPGTKPERNDKGVILRAKQVARIGGRRYLIFTVQNRGGDELDVQDIRLYLQEGTAETPLKAAWRLEKRSIVAGDQEVQGVVSVPLKRGPTAKTRLHLRLEAADPAQAIDLKGIGGL